MPHHKQKYHSKHSVDEIFSLVLDIERYPEFLPWCDAATINSQEEGEMLAVLVISFKGFAESYTSRVRSMKGRGHARVEAEAVDGPFDHLKNLWVMEADPGGGTSITFEIDFAFRSKVLQALLTFWFDSACMKMVKAFEERADKLYGQ